MATLLPVLFLARSPTVARAAAAAFLARGQAKLGGADGALHQDHRRLFGLLLVLFAWQYDLLVASLSS